MHTHPIAQDTRHIFQNCDGVVRGFALFVLIVIPLLLFLRRSPPRCSNDESASTSRRRKWNLRGSRSAGYIRETVTSCETSTFVSPREEPCHERKRERYREKNRSKFRDFLIFAVLFFVSFLLLSFLFLRRHCHCRRHRCMHLPRII